MIVLCTLPKSREYKISLFVSIISIGTGVQTGKVLQMLSMFNVI
jgi:hypothetical protein